MGLNRNQAALTCGNRHIKKVKGTNLAAINNGMWPKSSTGDPKREGNPAGLRRELPRSRAVGRGDSGVAGSVPRHLPEEKSSKEKQIGEDFSRGEKRAIN